MCCDLCAVKCVIVLEYVFPREIRTKGPVEPLREPFIRYSSDTVAIQKTIHRPQEAIHVYIHKRYTPHNTLKVCDDDDTDTDTDNYHHDERRVHLRFKRLQTQSKTRTEPEPETETETETTVQRACSEACAHSMHFADICGYSIVRPDQTA